MKKAMVSLLAVCALACSMTVAAGAAWEDDGVAIFIEDENFAPPADFEVIHGTTYVPIRAFCKAMDEQATVTWNKGTVSVTAKGLSINVTVGSDYLEANGRYFYIPDGCYMLNGNAMAPIRILALAFGASVEWDAANKFVIIRRGVVPIESGDKVYNSDDVYWLSRIIYAESGCEPLEGQIAVGNVVLNRVADPSCPSTIYDVIFDTRFGVQFSPIISGSIYNTPSDQAVIAAKLALEGANVASNSLFFQNESITGYNWMSSSRTFVAKIGAHTFYA